MADNMLAISDNARTLILADVRAFKRDGKRYADYVVECEVTHDNVADHVAEFRNTYKQTYPNATGDEVKAYATKVRNGLKYWLGKAETPANNTDWIRLVRQAAENAANKGGKSTDEILAAVADALSPVLALVETDVA